METTQLEGLEDFGNSETVSSISDFLSLDEIGYNVDQTEPDLVLTETDNGAPKPDLEIIDLGLPIEVPSVDKTSVNDTPPVDEPTQEKEKKDTQNPDTADVDLGEDNNTSTGFNYKEVVKDLIDSGVWDEIGAFETEDGEVPFDEMTIDKDMFVSLMKHNQKELEEKLTANTVATDGISEFTQKLISIEKHGGNVQQALQAYQTIKQPLDNIDITDERGQRAICYLRLQQNGIEGEEAKDLIDSYEIKGVLEEKAVAFKEQLDTAFNNWLAEREEFAKQEETRFREAQKAYRNSLNEVLKATKEFELSDTHRKKLVDIATKETEHGTVELDELIESRRGNPQEAAELILFLTDKDGYIQKKAKALLDEERKKTLKTISIIPKGKTNIDLSQKGDKSSKDDIIPLTKLR